MSAYVSFRISPIFDHFHRSRSKFPPINIFQGAWRHWDGALRLDQYASSHFRQNTNQMVSLAFCDSVLSWRQRREHIGGYATIHGASSAERRFSVFMYVKRWPSFTWKWFLKKVLYGKRWWNCVTKFWRFFSYPQRQSFYIVPISNFVVDVETMNWVWLCLIICMFLIKMTNSRCFVVPSPFIIS